jgi:hypothetical protein
VLRENEKSQKGRSSGVRASIPPPPSAVTPPTSHGDSPQENDDSSLEVKLRLNGKHLAAIAAFLAALAWALLSR